MASVILGLLFVSAMVIVLAYGVYQVFKGRDLPVHYFTIPLAVIAGMFAMSIVRSL